MSFSARPYEAEYEVFSQIEFDTTTSVTPWKTMFAFEIPGEYPLGKEFTIEIKEQ